MDRSQSGWTDNYSTDQGSYGYDAADNLASDSRKGLLFSYNLANLPSKVEGVGYNAGLTYSYGYLPFGTRLPGSLQSSGNRHRFGGKEEQRIGSTDLKLLDFGARSLYSQ